MFYWMLLRAKAKGGEREGSKVSWCNKNGKRQEKGDKEAGVNEPAAGHCICLNEGAAADLLQVIQSTRLS